MNDKENKSCIISFRVTAEEKKWIEDHSYGNYRLISDFVRDCVFKKDIVMLRRKAYSVACRTCSKEDFIFEMEMHGYKVDWQEGHKYITFTTPDGHKCRDNKLFAEQLLRKNLEIYFALGGCESGLADQYKS